MNNDYQILKMLGEAENYRQQQAAAQQAIASQNGWGGGLGAILSGIGGYMSGKKGRQASELEAQARAAMMEQERQAEAAQAQQAAIAQQQEREAKLNALVPVVGEEMAKAVVLGGIDPSDFKQDLTTLQKNTKAAGYELGTPEAQAYIRQNMGKNTGSTVNVHSGETQSEFQKRIAGKDAEKFNEWENAAWSANETMNSIGQLRKISQLQNTGMANEALAMAGQIFGTEAAANMQAYNSIASNMVLQQAEKLKGAMSDGDIKLLRQTMPNFGNDPRANEVVYSVLEQASQRAISRYKNAAKHVDEHGELKGFRPEFNYIHAEQGGQQVQQDYSKMSDEELMAAWKAKQGR